MIKNERIIAVSLFDWGIWRQHSLPALLDSQMRVVPPGKRAGPEVFAWAGWGYKSSGLRARRLAIRDGLIAFLIEDGFLRSLGNGKNEPPLSIVIDDLGIYYNAASPSRLEILVLEQRSQAQLERARTLPDLWRNAGVSKYNHAKKLVVALPSPYVLVADQTFGDASIRYGFAGPQNFQSMLQAALSENPGCTVLLKIHPDVFSGKKRGHFNVKEVSRIPRVRVLAEDTHPAQLIEQAEAVYVVTSQIGFEGLLWGKRVRTFGMPFYAGWGLTQDELPAPERRKPVSLENLLYAALVEYPRYVDPETGQRCEVERLIVWMGLQRRMRERFPPEVYALGFSRWKKPIVRSFFQGSSVEFARKANETPTGAMLAVWGRKPVPGGIPGSAQPVCLEDGFLRSVGLGADLVTPLSWVMDRRGIYYDANVPSDLEALLQNHSFDSALCERGEALRNAIVRHGLTKYNVGNGRWARPEQRPNDVKLASRPHQGGGGMGQSHIILVPGQVESDASIRYGTTDIRTNLGLLQAVRRANPDAYIVYKPHPDVIAGLRSKGEDEDEAAAWCDEIVTDVPMHVMLGAADEVHVLTSLAGFEALLRGKRVVTYGQPFYAGWGLTADKAPPLRRTRKLTLDELVAGTLILYPTYISRTTGRFTTPERALEELLIWREESARGMPLWRKGLRVILQALKVNG